MIGRWDLIGVACVVAFVAAYAVNRAERPAAPARATGGEPGAVRLGHEWMGLHHQGRRVGVLHLEKRATEGGYRFDFETELRLQAMGSDASMRVRVGADLGLDLALRHFDFSVLAGPARFSGAGLVDGRDVRLTVSTGGETTTRTLSLPEPPVLRASLGPLLSRERLTPGQTLRYHAFDPLTQQDQVVDVEVIGQDEIVALGEAVPVTHLRQRVGGLVLDGWMNAEGEMLRQELGLGLVAIRETEEEARWGLRAAAAPDLMGALMIDAPGLPPSLADAAGLRVRFAGAGAAAVLALPGDDRQRVEAGEIVVRRERVGPGLPLPVTDAPAESLAATTTVQAAHPRIRAAAEAAVGDAGDTVEATRRLTRWIAEHVEQRPVPGIPSALETLQSGVGDCNEHATLFAALARSLGVPTQIVVGVVYREGRFGYHAWNEVLTAEGWLSVDPTWRQLPADPGHVRLVRGGLDQQVALLRLIGQLQVVESAGF